MERLALQLLESAVEMRPSAAQAVEQLASMGLRDAGFEEEKAVGSDEATQGQGEGNSPIGIRDGVQEDVAGAKLEPSSDQVGTKLEPPFQYNDHELFELQMTLKQFMDTSWGFDRLCASHTELRQTSRQSGGAFRQKET